MPPGWQPTAGEVEDGIGESVEGGGGCSWLDIPGALPLFFRAAPLAGSPDPNVDCKIRGFC